MLQIQQTFKNDFPTIYIVGTPIGNLEDISNRVIETFKNADLIYCEDTRVSLKLFERLNLSKKLKAVHKFNEYEIIDEVLEDLKSNKNIVLISDAGVPCISDPGALLLNQLFKSEVSVNVTAVNCGPAYVHALASSGFISRKNFFLGFLDKKNVQEEIGFAINNLIGQDSAISFYESVHRIQSTLNQLSLLISSETKVLVARELTKKNEEFIRGTISEICEHTNSSDFIQKGEFCVVIDSKFKLAGEVEFDFERIINEVQILIDQGISKKDSVKSVSKKYKINKNFLTKIFYK